MIVVGDARTAIPDVPVHLVVTSPPYNVGIDYESHDDEMSPDEYRSLIYDVLLGCWDQLVPGGRMAVNVVEAAGRSPAYPVGNLVQTEMLSLPDALYRGAIVWNKGAAAGSSTAWGSWRSPSNPVLRGVYEMIYVISKDSMTLTGDTKDEMTADEFTQATIDVWNVGTAAPSELGLHPVPFPHQLAARLIALYSHKGQTVLDPFFGSGTTGLAAEMLGRNWVGVELSAAYAEVARKRISDYRFGEDVEVRHA